MNSALESFFNGNLLKAPQLLGEGAIERSRAAALSAARVLDGTKAPSHRLAEAGLKVNAVIHHSVARLVNNQVRVLDGFVDEGVRRLELAAEASALRPLIVNQIGLLADTGTRLAADARRTLSILADTRAQLSEVFTAAPAKGPATPARRARPARATSAGTRRAKKRGARAR
jgi:hypothetical protein